MQWTLGNKRNREKNKKCKNKIRPTIVTIKTYENQVIEVVNNS